MISIHEKSALILIDWQQGILSQTQLPQKEVAIKNVAQLVKQFQQKQKPVAFVTVLPDGDWLKTAKEVPTSNQNLPPNFATLHSDLQPTKNDWQIRKHQWSAFVLTELPALLKQKGITQLVFAGISTSIGVEGSVRDASPLGFELILVEDAMLDLNAECHQHSVKHIFPRLGVITDTKTILPLI